MKIRLFPKHINLFNPIKAVSIFLVSLMILWLPPSGIFAAQTDKDFTLDDGTGDSPQVILKDETGDGELTLQKKDAGEADIINTEGTINLKPSNNPDDYIYVFTGNELTGIYFKKDALSYFYWPGVRINDTGQLEYRDQDADTWVTFDSMGAVSGNFGDLADVDLSGLVQGDIVYYNGTEWVRLAAGTAGQVLTSDGAGGLSWSTINGTVADGTSANNTLRWDGSNWVESTAFTNDGTDVTAGGNITVTGDLTVTGDDITMATNTAGALLVGDGANYNPVVASGDAAIAADGTITISNNAVDGTDIAMGSDVQGDILFYDGTDYVRLPAGTSGQVLQTQGNTADPVWANAAMNTNLGNDDQTLSGARTVTMSGNDLTLDGTGDIVLSDSGDITTTGDASINGADLTLGEGTTAAAGTIILHDADGGDSNTTTLASNADVGASFTLTLPADAGTASQVLTTDGSGALSWSTISGSIANGTSVNNTLRWNGSNWLESSALTNDGTDVSAGGNISISGDLTVTGDDITMTTNTSGAVLVGDGTNFNPVVAAGDATIASDGTVTIADNAVDGTDIAMGSDAQGDVLYYDGTDYVRLAPGTSGQVLQTQGAGANPQWANAAADTNLGDDDQILSGARTVTMSGNDLTLDGTGDIVLADSGDITTAGDVAVDGGDITTTSTTANVVNSNATTVNIAGASTTTAIGAATGTTTIGNDLAVANNATVSGDLTVTGDDITMTTNTAGALLVGDGTNFNPVVASGDATVAADGTITIANNAVDGTDMAMGSDAQGDILYYDGTDYVRLPAGTSGQVLQTQGAAADPMWANAAVDTNLGANDQTLSGARTVTMSGNDLTLDGTGDIVLADSGNITTTGDVAVDGGDITTTATTANVVNTNATAVNIAGASTTTAIGSTASGTTTVGYDLTISNDATISGNATVSGADLTIGDGTTAAAGTIILHDGEAVGTETTTIAANADVTTSYTLTLPAATGTANQVLETDGSGNLSWADVATTNIYSDDGTLAGARTVTMSGNDLTLNGTGDIVLADSGNITTAGDVAVNGGDLTTTSTTANILNTNATAVNIAGASTATAIGAATGTTTIGNDLTATGDVAVNGGDITSTATALNMDVADTGTIALRDGTNTLLSVADGGTVGNVTATGTLTASGGSVTTGSDGTDGSLVIYSEQGGTDYSYTINPNAAATQDVTLTLPADDGTANQVLATDGSGALSWADANDVTDGTAANNTLRWDGSAWVESTALTNDGTDVAASGNITATGDMAVNGGDITSTATALNMDVADTGTIALRDGTNNLLTVVDNGSTGNVTATGTLTASGGSITTGSDGTDGSLVIYSEQGSTDYSYTLNPHATATQNVTLTLPADDGTANQVLATDGSGALSWADANGVTDGTAASNTLRWNGTAWVESAALTNDGTDVAASGNITATGDVAVNGGDITSTATALNVDVGDTGTIALRDGTNTLLSVADAGTTGNVTATGTLTASGGSVTTGSDGTDGSLVIYSEQGGTDYSYTINPNAAATQDVTLTLPADDGTANQVLATDGSGALSWADANGVTDGTAVNNTLRWNGTTWVESAALTNDGTDVAAGGNITATGDVAVNGGDITSTATVLNMDVANTGTIALRDGTNTLLSVVDAGTTGNVTATGTLTASGGSVTTGSDGTDGSLVIYSEQGVTDYSYTVNPNAAATQNVTLTLPADDGNANQVLETDGSGNLSWADVATTNIYSDDGTLAAARTITTGGNSLTIDGTGDIVLADSGNITTAGDVALNGGDLTTTSTTANILNTNATAVNIAGASTATAIGAATGTTTIGNDLTATGDVAVNGGDITSTATALNMDVADTGTIALRDGTNNLLTVVDNGSTGNVTATGTLTASGGSVTTGSDGTDGSLVIYSEQGGTDYSYTINPNTAATQNVTLTLPVDDGTANQVLETDGSGNLSWADVATTNLYSGDGTLAGARTVAMSGNDLTLDGTGDIVLADSGNITTAGDVTATGDVAVNGGDITTTSTTANVVNANATTVNMAGASTTTAIGSTASGTTTVGYDLTVSNDATISGNVTVSGADLTLGDGTTAAAGSIILHDADIGDSFTTTLASNADVGASFTLTLPADDGTADQVLTTDGSGALSWADANGVTDGTAANNTLRWDGSAWVESTALTNDGTDVAASGNITATGDVAVNGGDITTTAGTANVVNTNATAVNIAGVSTATAIGSTASGTTTVGYDLTVNNDATISGDASVTGDATVSGADLTLGDGTTAAAGSIILHDADIGDSFTTTLASNADVGADFTLTLPADDGDANQVLATDGSGALSWTDANGVTDGTAANNTLRWNGTSWIESTALTNDGTDVAAGGNITATGDVAANGGDITTTAATANVVNTNATTVNIAGASTATAIGAATGTTTIGNDLAVTNDATVTGDVIVSGADLTLGDGTTAAAGSIILHDADIGDSFTTTLASNADVGADFALTLPADDGDANQVLATDGSGALSWADANGVTDGTTANNTLRWNGTAWVESSALTNDGTDVAAGGNITATGDVAVNGGDITTTSTTANVVNANATTVNIAGASTATAIGAATGTTTIGNDLAVTNDATVTGDVIVSGADLTIGDGTTATAGTIVLHDNQAGDSFTTTLASNDDVDADFTLTLPADDGTANQILETDGSGNLSWTDNTDVADGTAANNTLRWNGTSWEESTALTNDGTDVAASGNITATGDVAVNGGDITTTATALNMDVADTGTIALRDGTNTLLSVADGGTVGNVTATGTLTASGGSVTTGSDGTDGSLVIYSEQGVTDYSYTINPHATATQNVTLTLPADDGTANQVLATDGSGALSWTDANGVTDGTAANNTLRWDGTSWIESTALTNDGTDVAASGNITVTGDVAANGGDITTTAGTANVVNSNATTVNIAGASTSTAIGAATGTTTIGNDLAVTNDATVTGDVTVSGADLTLGDGTTAAAGTIVLHDNQAGDSFTTTLASNDDVDANFTLTLPADDGTANQILETDGSGNLSWTDNTGVADGTAANNTLRWNGTSWEESTALTNDGTDIAASGNITATGTLTASGGSVTTGSDGTDGSLVIYSEQGGTDYSYTINPNTAATQNVTLTLPADDGTANQVLATDGSGALSWADANGVTNGTAANNTLHWDGSDWVESTALTNDGTDVAASGNITATGDVAVNGGDITTTATALNMDVADTGTIALRDGTNTLLSVADGGTVGNVTATGTLTASGGSVTTGSDGTDGSLVVYSEQGVTDYTYTINPNAAATQNVTLTLPADDGNANEVLTTDGSGALSWADANGVTDGTATSNTLRWNGSSWVESTALTNDGTDVAASGNITATGDVAVNGGDITTSSATANVVNTTPTTVNIAGASTATAIGAATGTTTIGNDLTATGDTTVTGGDITVGAGTTAKQGAIVFHDNQAADSFTTTIQAADDVNASFTLTLPADDGTSGQVLSTDGSGALSWADANGVTDGTAANNTLRWNGTSWEESTALTNDGTDVAVSGNITATGDVAVNGGDITSTATALNVDVGNTGAIALRDGTNTLLSVADGGTVGNVTATGTLTASGGSVTTGSDGTDGSLVVYSEQGVTDYTYTINPNAAATQNVTLTLPADDGNANEVLTTDGSGALSWADANGVTDGTAANNTLRWNGTAWLESTALTNDGTDVAATGNVTVTGDVAINGGDITTTAGTANVVNTNATAVNIAGASTATAIGSTASGTTTVGYDLTVSNDATISGDASVTGDATVSGADLTLGDGTTAAAGSIILHDADIGDSFTTTLASNADVGADFTLTLPADDGDANQILATDGSGALSWTDANGVTDGTAANNTLRWNGTSWIESTALTNDGTDVAAGGNITATGDVAVNGGDITSTATALNMDVADTGTIALRDGTNNLLTVVDNGSTGNVTATGTLTASGGSITTGSDGTDGSLVIYSEQGATDYSYTLNPNAAATQNVTLTLPVDDGTANQVLETDGSGNLSWADVTTTNIYSDNGTLAGARTVTMSGNSLTLDGTGDIVLADSGNITTAGDVAVNGGDLTTTSTTANILNTNATTVNIAGASTATAIGAATGTTTIGNDLTATGDVAVNGGDITSTATALNMDVADTGTIALRDGTNTLLSVVDGGTVGNVTATGTLTASGGSVTSGSDGTDGSLVVYSEQGATDYSYTINPNAAATQNVTLTLPADDGDANQVLATDGSGALSWADANGVTDGTAANNTLRWNGSTWEESTALTNDGTDVAAGGNITATGDVAVNGGDITSTATALNMDVADTGTIALRDGTNTLLSVADAGSAGNVTATGTLTTGSDGQDGALSIYSEQGATDYTYTINPNASASQNVALTLPADDGDADQVLTTDGSGALSWTDANGVTDGTATSNTLRWNGSSWVESTALTNDGTDITASGDVAVNGGDITTTAGTANLVNTNATAVNIAGASTATAIGAATGTTTIGNDATITGDATVSGAGLTIGDGTTAAAGSIVLHDADSGDSFTTTLTSNADVGADFTLTLPADDGTANQILETDGSGNLSWADANGVTDGTAANNTLRWNGSDWVESTALTNDGTDVAAGGNITATGDVAVNGGDITTTATALNMDVADTGTIALRDGTNTLLSVADAGTTGNVTATGTLTTGSDGQDGALSIYSEQGATDYSYTINPNAAATQNVTLTLPADDGTANQVLATDGSGALSWADANGVTDGTATNNTLRWDGSAWGESTALTNDGTDVTASGNITATGDVAANGGDITTTAATANVVNTNATTVNIAGASTATAIGAATGTTTIGNDLTVTNNATVTGGDVTIGSGTVANAGSIVLHDADAGDSFTTTLASNADVGADFTLTLPADDGTANQILETDGSGNLSWADANGVADGTAANNTLRWNGSAWVESTALSNDGTDVAAGGNITATGDVAVNGGDITTTAATANVVNTNATTVNIAGASTATAIGAATGTTTIGNDLTVTNNATVTGGDVTIGSGTVANAGSIVLHDADAGDSFTTTLASNADVGADFTLTLPADDGTANQILETDGSGNLSWADNTGVANGTVTNNTLRWNGTAWVESTALINDDTDVTAGGNITATGDVAVNGGDITTTAATANVVNTNATTVNIAGASTATAIGAATGTTTIGNDLAVTNDATVTGDVTVSGADLTLGDGTTAAAGTIVLHDNQAGDSFTTTLASNDDVDADFTLTLPADDGTANQILETDGSGNLSWADNTGVADGTAANNTLRWNGTAWVESSALTNDGTDVAAGGNITATGDVAVNGGDITTTATALNMDVADTGTIALRDGTNNLLTVVDNGSTGNVTATGTLTASGGSVTTGSDGTDGSLVIYSEQGATDYSYTLNPNAAATQNVTLTLPVDDGTANQVLETDGSGNLSWADVATTNIYSDDGTLAGARTVTMSGNNLTLDGTGDIVLADSGNITTAGDVAVNGGDLTTTSTTANILNTNATTVNIAGASTATAIGAATGMTTIGNDLTATGDVAVNGGDITTTATALNMDVADTGTIALRDGTNTLLSVADGGTVGNVTATGTLTASGGSVTTGSDGTDGSLVIYSEQGGTDYSYTINPNAAATQDVTLTLPADDGTANQVLATDGSGALSWASAVSANGTAANNTLRWDGSNWVESTLLTNDGTAGTGYITVANNLRVGSPSIGHITVDGSDAVIADDVEIDGDLWVDGTFSAPSDIRLKTNIATLSDVLAKIGRLRGVRYEFKDQDTYASGPQIGLIAQDLQTVFPELVTKGADGYLAINYTRLSAVFVQAINEQQRRIDILTNRMDKQQAQINELYSRLNFGQDVK